MARNWGILHTVPQFLPVRQGLKLCRLSLDLLSWKITYLSDSWACEVWRESGEVEQSLLERGVGVLGHAPGLEPSLAQKELMPGTAPPVSGHAQRAPLVRGHSSQAAGELISGIRVRSPWPGGDMGGPWPGSVVCSRLGNR